MTHTPQVLLPQVLSIRSDCIANFSCMQVNEWVEEHRAAWSAWQQQAEQTLRGGHADLVLIERLHRDVGQFAFGTAAIDHVALQKLSARLAAALAWSDKVCPSSPSSSSSTSLLYLVWSDKVYPSSPSSSGLQVCCLYGPFLTHLLDVTAYVGLKAMEAPVLLRCLCWSHGHIIQTGNHEQASYSRSPLHPAPDLQISGEICDHS